METVKIGKQEWTVKNFDVDVFRNGQLIQEIQNPVEWQNATIPAWCYYENKSENAVLRGRLYNGYAILDKQNLAPDGFHIPTIEEFNELIEYIGGEDFGYKLKTKEKGTWKSCKGIKKGSDEFGFNAYPTGLRVCTWGPGPFVNFNEYTRFWSATLLNEDTLLGAQLGYGDDRFLTSGRIFSECKFNSGFSVRLIKNQ
ncbi:MAG: hypothetical protein FJ347_04365 [Sphingomonadales bacterium]|nr:hypothetical protein [Sphingomonadales bacterium]